MCWHLIAECADAKQAVSRFAVTELSNFYLDVAKDRLYVRGQDSLDRRCSIPILTPIPAHTLWRHSKSS